MTFSSFSRGRGFKPLLLAVALSAGLHTGAALAQGAPASQTIDIPAGSLAQALDRLGEQTGVLITYEPGLVQGRNAPRVSGRLSPGEALRRLLGGSGIQVEAVNDRTFVLKPASAPTPEPQTAPSNVPAATQSAEPEVQELERLTVTGTRIRAGTTPSPVITIGAENIREEGFTDLGQVIRAVPQNFSGGQNPGVIGVSGSAGSQDVTGGSALNLRGLGADASLTLLNGRRLAYDGWTQAVDISAIPVEAVERLEIVTDGASAVYGSDAVGGVANVILARDFDGVAVGVRYGGATDGGLTTREYSMTAGTTWAGGGLIATLKDASVDPIYTHQRSYTSHLARPYTIYNGWDARNGLVSLHQSIAEVAELRIDALRTERETTKHITQPSIHQRNEIESSVALVSPSIEFFLPRDWSLILGGTSGKSESIEVGYLVSAGESSLAALYGYDNTSLSFEVGAEGPLFAVGGGDVRLAVGLGSRENEFLFSHLVADVGFDGDERARYGYAEVVVPLVSPASAVAGIRRLEFSAAVRGEDYDSFGRVATPKFGVIYDPSADFTLKASWGKSFKAPTMNQRYSAKVTYLWAASMVGGSSYPSDATVVDTWGGNSELEAERARTWTASLALHPEAWPGLDAELTWFDIDYTDRVVLPVTYWQQALSNPGYAEFVELSPTADRLAEVLAVYGGTFYNFAGAVYDPERVVARVNSQFVNAARQRIRGVDLSGSYGFGLGSGRLTVRGSASWLKSSQTTSAGQPEFDLAGTAFHPAKFNGRVGAVWASGGLSASGFVNHTGGVTTDFAATPEKTGSFTTVDATLSYDTGVSAGAFSGLTFGLSVQNLLGREPPLYTPPNPNYVPYDATNYSVIGRFISASISKRW